jgi:hypothetical protein
MARDENISADTSGRTGDDPDQLHGTPDDLKPGRRRTIGMDPDGGAGSDVPGSTASD